MKNCQGVKVTWGMRVLLVLLTFHFSLLTSSAQRLLTLDSCRAMALRNNKQMGVAKVKQEVAANIRKSARTKYLPHVSAIGSYHYTSREVSLLSDEQKSNLSNLGTNLVGGVQQDINEVMASPAMQQVTALLSSMGLPLDGLSQMTGTSSSRATAASWPPRASG